MGCKNTKSLLLSNSRTKIILQMTLSAARLIIFTRCCKPKCSESLTPPILFITPPFTQLNAPYPATTCLKGFMNTRHIASAQCDLGMEVILALFSKDGLTGLFEEIDRRTGRQADGWTDGLNANAKRMVRMKDRYVETIGPVIEFLQGRKPELAYRICDGSWLPEAGCFTQMSDLDHDFGHLGIIDRAKHLATRYLDDIASLITETIDPHFGFSRYAERLGRSAASFDELQSSLDRPGGTIESLLTGLLREQINRVQPSLVAITIPFPGNLYSALKCGQWIKKHHPGIKIALGGGLVNTELRSVADPRVFDYCDFITLDDGETPLSNLVEYMDGKRTRENLRRTFMRVDGTVVFFDGSAEPDVPENEKGTPDYSGLPVDKYLSVIEVANPMHRLWNDGFWNKLTLAHGCYWAKCTFCDGSLDYIKRYEPNKPALICDRMAAIMTQTGRHGFHFTDEAAPPALLRDLALEILRRKLTVVWWTNIRFEKNFTPDLCLLLKKSGCIAVSGGLEVASDRILKMINKGVTVPQVARVAGNFTRAGIMVHAYLMYGFPTQTAQETIDSLEVVRQLFMNGVVQSGFWHQFAMTAHSAVGMDPQQFGIEKENTPPGAFANNDLVAIDRQGCDHETFSEGLKKSLYNYMHGICFDFPLQEWFDFRIPRPTIAKDFIRNIISSGPLTTHDSPLTTHHFPRTTHPSPNPPDPNSKILWPGILPSFIFYTRQKKGKSTPAAKIIIQTIQQEMTILADEPTGKWLEETFPLLVIGNHDVMTFQRLAELYTTSVGKNFMIFRDGSVMKQLRENGLVIV